MQYDKKIQNKLKKFHLSCIQLTWHRNAQICITVKPIDRCTCTRTNKYLLQIVFLFHSVHLSIYFIYLSFSFSLFIVFIFLPHLINLFPFHPFSFIFPKHDTPKKEWQWIKLTYCPRGVKYLHLLRVNHKGESSVSSNHCLNFSSSK